MTLKDLGDGLRELAGEVRTVDMYDRAIRASRRLRARRAAAIGAVGLCVVALLVLGVARIPAVQGVRPAGNAAVEAPASEPEESVTDAAGLRTAYYLQETAPSAYTVYAWEETGPAEPAAVLDGGDLFAETVAISPDGRYAAYYTEDHMVVVDVRSGSDEAVVSFPTRGDPCLEPTWTADSTTVLLADVGGDVQLVSLTDGVSSVPAYRPDGCHVRLFGYGDDAAPAYAYVDEDGKTVRYESAFDGTEVAAPTAYEDAPALAGVAAVSSDGGYQCLAYTPFGGGAPGGRALECDALATPQGLADVPLPVSGTLLSAAFTPYLSTYDAAAPGPVDAEVADTVLRIRVDNGSQVLLHTAIATAAADAWTEAEISELVPVDSFTEPDVLAGARLLTYVP